MGGKAQLELGRIWPGIYLSTAGLRSTALNLPRGAEAIEGANEAGHM